jgi:uncharacterized membrane protein
MNKPKDYIRYTDDIAHKICTRLAAGELLIDICDTDDMPNFATVYRWVGERPDFRDAFNSARSSQAHFLAERSAQHAKTATVQEANLARLRMDADRWLAGKLNPIYSDKAGGVTVNTTVDNSTVIQADSLSPEERAALRQALQAAAAPIIDHDG